uniref:Fe2OG dioxygenase domain-containing protein n=2 Tax=Ditylum brightwellii TaxID=49249 RepID=A0A6S8SXT3_9STRA|mmetsp:Transcript_8043/g.10814  ORF Transcript_8043/g.10814 Transcript_8043/m.10814 type:complete len:539 (+) Transcript_8043:95-1711(+)
MKCSIEGWHSCSAICYREAPKLHHGIVHDKHRCVSVASYHHPCNYHRQPCVDDNFSGPEDDCLGALSGIDDFSLSDGCNFCEERQQNNGHGHYHHNHHQHNHQDDLTKKYEDVLETASIALVLAAAAAVATRVSTSNTKLTATRTTSNPPLSNTPAKLPLYRFNHDRTNFHYIPVINMQDSKSQIYQSLNDACRNVGFFYVINHGISQTLMSEMFTLSKQFFQGLSINEKMKIHNTSSTKGLRGYFQIGQEDLNDKFGARDCDAKGGKYGEKSNANINNTNSKTDTLKGDYKEGFDCGREVPSNDGSISSMFGPNLWPKENDINDGGDGDKHETFLPKIFREKALQYQNELLQLADELLIAFACSLNLTDENYFVKQSRDPMCTLRLLHYPPTLHQQPQKQEGQQRRQQQQLGCGAHTDYGLFTILSQDDIGGLQILNGGGEWIKATPIPGSFVINVGDMMNRWTNGLYSSTIHRVVTNTSRKDRYSIPFFFNPDVDAVVEPLDSCCSLSSSSKKYKTETAGEILLSRYKGTFSQVKK